MARCGCTGATSCGCGVSVTNGLSLSGTGAGGDPFVLATAIDTARGLSFQGGLVATDVVAGDLRHNGSSGDIEFDPAAWLSYTPTFYVGGTVFTPAGGAIIVGRYKLVGRLCIVRARLQWGATTSFGALTGEINVSLPFAATAEMAIDSVAFGTVSILDSAVAVFARHAQFRNRGGVSTVYGITEAGTVVAHNTPITPTVGDFYSWNLTYETIS